jgi:hypothetical protein
MDNDNIEIITTAGGRFMRIGPMDYKITEDQFHSLMVQAAKLLGAIVEPETQAWLDRKELA